MHGTTYRKSHVINWAFDWFFYAISVPCVFAVLCDKIIASLIIFNLSVADLAEIVSSLLINKLPAKLLIIHVILMNDLVIEVI
jgi:hypothetical protein